MFNLQIKIILKQIFFIIKKIALYKNLWIQNLLHKVFRQTVIVHLYQNSKYYV